LRIGRDKPDYPFLGSGQKTAGQHTISVHAWEACGPHWSVGRGMQTSAGQCPLGRSHRAAARGSQN
jgi:hypothetical protein